MVGHYDLVVGCVGKPSAGKSTFFNAATDAVAKVGNYPFTTIEPNIGVTHFPMRCPCAALGKTDSCLPRHGSCSNGTRYVPIKLLDVAGLVPGACNGEGLGNKFLNDLCDAHILIHVIDVSGTTNEKGEATLDYDPINDVNWLHTEIHNWIFNNLWTKWSSITRRHVATRSTAAETLGTMLSGYGSTLGLVQKVLDNLGIKEPSQMETWSEAQVHSVVDGFLDERFPTILALNKADHAGSDKNIARICAKYGEDRVVVVSALAECFLRKMAKGNFIRYESGGEDFFFFGEEPPASLGGGGAAALKECDEKTKNRLNNIRDMVLCRYGGTGVLDAISRAVAQRPPVVAFPVQNMNSFSATPGGSRAFTEHILLKPGTTMKQFASILSADLEKNFNYAEGVDGRRLGEDEVVTGENAIIKIVSKHET